jgi:hypothetical protein
MSTNPAPWTQEDLERWRAYFAAIDKEQRRCAQQELWFIARGVVLIVLVIAGIVACSALFGWGVGW